MSRGDRRNASSTGGHAASAVSRAGFPLAEDAARRPKALILDFFGAYVREIGGWVRVADLVVLMGRLGVDEPSTRAAAARMISSGLLERVTRDRRRGYSLTRKSLDLLEAADRRILPSTGPEIHEAGGWLIVSFSLPETMRSQRHVLRSRLSWLGFGNLSSGLWIAPTRWRSELEAAVAELGLQEYVDYFVGTYGGFDRMPALVERCWDLVELRRMYGEFIETVEPVLDRWRQAALPTDADAFVDYTITLYHWRRFPYLDPGLPKETLPDGWEAHDARELFRRVHEIVQPRALRYVRSVASGP